MLWSSTFLARPAFSQVEDDPGLSQKKDDLVEDDPGLSQKRDDLTPLPDQDPLDVLGKEDMTTLRSSWGLTVNDQCLYEFVYQFQHNPILPVGEDSFQGGCDFGNLDVPRDPIVAPDGLLYLEPRRFYERFPDYVWATMGFNHIGVDWLPCGRMPSGYKTAQYDLSFFRVTPEFRAETMTCKLKESDSMTIVPGQEFCDTEQEDPKGMNFFVVPAAIVNREPVVNMPKEFTHRHLTDGPLPHIGLRSLNPDVIPDKPSDWNDVPVFMSSYAGKLVMWQAHIPYTMIKGGKRQFHSNADRYFETTIPTIPDTWSVKYNEQDGTVQFTIVGKAEMCRGDYERAQKIAGGPPVFPTYEEGSAGSGGKDGDKSGSSSTRTFRNTSSTTILQMAMVLFALTQ